MSTTEMGNKGGKSRFNTPWLGPIPEPEPDDTVKIQEFESLGSEVAQLRNITQDLLTELTLATGTSTVPIMDIKHASGIGKYMIPAENTLQNHYKLVMDRQNGLDFWSDHFPAFDGLVSQTFLDPGFTHGNHPDYYRFEPLRDNIAVLRNALLPSVLHGVDMSDPDQHKTAVLKVEQMGREIGVALQRDSLFRLMGSEKLDVLEASQPGVGAARMYELLLAKQNRPMLSHPWDWLRRRNYSHWNLPALADSPFSKENVTAFCLSGQDYDGVDAETGIATDPAGPQQQTAPQQNTQAAPEQAAALSFTGGNQLAVLGASIAGTAISLDRVERLPRPVKKEAVQLARDILDKMKMNVAGDTLPQWLEHPKEDAISYADALDQVAQVYADTHRIATLADPEMLNHPFVQQANLAIGKMSVLLKYQAANVLEQEGKVDDAQMVRAEIEYLPNAWKDLKDTDTLDTLVGHVQLGLEVTYSSVREAELRWKRERDVQTEAPQQAQQQAAVVVPTEPQQRPVAATPTPDDQHVAIATEQLLAHQQHGPQRSESSADMGQLISSLSPEEMQMMKDLGASAHSVSSPEELQRQRTQGAVRSRQMVSARSHDNFTDTVDAQKAATQKPELPHR